MEAGTVETPGQWTAACACSSHFYHFVSLHIMQLARSRRCAPALHRSCSIRAIVVQLMERDAVLRAKCKKRHGIVAPATVRTQLKGSVAKSRLRYAIQCMESLLGCVKPGRVGRRWASRPTLAVTGHGSLTLGESTHKINCVYTYASPLLLQYVQCQGCESLSWA